MAARDTKKTAPRVGTAVRKLRLSKETLRDLDTSGPADVKGGVSGSLIREAA